MVSSISSNASQLLSSIYSKLDKNNQGYFQLEDLQSSLSSSTGTGSTSSSDAASDLFDKLDSNGDGKVTESELSSGLKKLANELNSEFDKMRMVFANESPSSQADETQNTQTESSAVDGTSALRGMPPPPPPPPQNGAGSSESESSSSTASGTTNTSTTSTSSNDSDTVMSMILRLLKAYGENTASSLGGTLSTSV